jgi:hypothetical protein
MTAVLFIYRTAVYDNVLRVSCCGCFLHGRRELGPAVVSTRQACSHQLSCIRCKLVAIAGRPAEPCANERGNKLHGIGDRRISIPGKAVRRAISISKGLLVIHDAQWLSTLLISIGQREISAWMPTRSLAS